MNNTSPRPKRREARRLAMLATFAQLCTGYPMDETLQLLSTMNPQWAELPSFTKELAQLVETHRTQLETEIQSVLEHWRLERLGLVERSLLLLGTVEILQMADIPPRVTINEYLELAKLYAPDQAPAFINGVLDKIVKKHGKPDFEIWSARTS
jgi:N utilization substance protein B